MTENYSLFLIALALFVGMMISQLFSTIIRENYSYVHFRNIRLNLLLLLEPAAVLIPVACLIIIFPLLEIPRRFQPFLTHGIQLSVIASLGWAAKRVITMLRDTVLEHYNVATPDNLNARRINTQVRIIEHVINFILIIITMAFMVMSFSEAKEVGISIFASAGVVSVIIGFAAQKSLGNLLAGLQLAITQPIRLEDAVIVENEWGWIEEITLTYVVIRIWDLRRLVVPISYFIENPFQNWTRTSADLLGSVFLYTDYSVPVEELRKELTRVLEQSTRWDKKVNVLQVTDIKEHTVELRALMSAANSSIAWDLRCEVREKMLNFLQRNYPHALPQTRVQLRQEIKSKQSFE